MVWVGWEHEGGQGPGMLKMTPRCRPLSGAWRGKGPGVRVFRGIVRPVTNSKGPTIHLGKHSPLLPNLLWPPYMLASLLFLTSLMFFLSFYHFSHYLHSHHTQCTILILLLLITIYHTSHNRCDTRHMLSQFSKHLGQQTTLRSLQTTLRSLQTSFSSPQTTFSSPQTTLSSPQTTFTSPQTTLSSQPTPYTPQFYTVL